MAGVKGRSGGPRPGSGRKRVETVIQQASRRGAVLDVISDEEWREYLKSLLVIGRRSPQVLFPLLPYLLGGQKQEINVSGQIDHVQMDAAKTVLRIVGGTDKRAS